MTRSPEAAATLDTLLSKVEASLRRRIRTLYTYLQVQDDDVILDCGCSDGIFTEVIGHLHGCQIIGVDFNESLLFSGVRRLRHKSNVNLAQADLYNLPFPREQFDKIVLADVLEHLSDEMRALRELARVLKPQGMLAITVPNSNYPLLWDPMNWFGEHLGLGHFSKDNGLLGGIWAEHLRLYTPNQLRGVVEAAGFTVEQISALTRYCLPFNHNALYFTKQIIWQKLPSDVRQSMDKFSWEEGPRSGLVKLAKGFADWIDQHNERELELEGPALHVALTARKRST